MLATEPALRDLQQHDLTNATYIEEGIQLVEIARDAVEVYNQQEMRKKRRIRDVVLSNSTFSSGKVYPVY